MTDFDMDRLQRYLQALETARSAIEDARALYPDLGLDHAIDRLRGMVSQAAMRLSQCMDDRQDASPRSAA